MTSFSSTHLDVYARKSRSRRPLKTGRLWISIISTAVFLSMVTIIMYLAIGPGSILSVEPWYVPAIHSFIGLAAIGVAILALGRFPVWRDPTSFWIGVGFASFAVESVFFILSWPGLLPGGRGILARLPGTSAWFSFLELTTVGLALLAAALRSNPELRERNWPQHQTVQEQKWLWKVLVWLGIIVVICLFMARFEASLPVLVNPNGSFRGPFFLLNWIVFALYLLGAVLCVRRYRQSGDALLGYVGIVQLCIAFAVATAVIGGKRYDLWFYTGRLILSGGFLTLFMGLLGEYIQLFRREHDARLLLDSIMENVPVGLAVTGGGPDYPLLGVSRYGLKMSMAAQNELKDPFSPIDSSEWKSYLPDGVHEPTLEERPLYRASHTGEVTQNSEFIVEMQDGKRIPVLVNATPIMDRNGRIVAALSSWMDISERKQAEARIRQASEILKEKNESLERYTQELEQANRDLQSFTVVTSHDLQEPLRKAEMFAHAISENGSNLDKSQQEYLSRMCGAIQQMRNLVNGLFQLTNLTSQAQPFQSISVAQITDSVVDEYAGRMNMLGGRIVIGELPMMEADPNQIRMLLRNLIENAIKFGPKNGTLVVQITSRVPKPEWVEISITDNGIGFSDTQAEHLFEPFERLVGKNQPEYDGSGMGLAICRRIVERHGGTISAHGEPGQGATFLINLPVHPEPRPNVSTQTRM